MSELRANWGLVLAACICSSIVGIHYHFIGTLIKPLGAAYGWSRGDTSLALTIASATLPVTAVTVGWLGDSLGPRQVVLPGIILYGVCFALLGLAAPRLWAWYLGFTLFSILGFGAGIVLWSKALVQNFDEQRGLALALCSSGVGVLIAIIPSLVLFLISTVGLRGIFFAWGALSIAIMFPIAWLFCPEGKGSERETKSDLMLDKAGGQSAIAATFSRPIFWMLAMAITGVGICNGPLTVQLQPILTDSGMSPMAAAHAAIVMGPALLIGRIGVGFLFDRFPMRLVATCCFLTPAVAAILLNRLDGSLAIALPAVIVAALSLGADVDVAGYLTSRYLGLEHYGFAFGCVIGLYGLGVSIGSVCAGYIHDYTNGNFDVFLMIGVMSIVSTSLILLFGPDRGAKWAAHDGKSSEPG